MSSLDDIILEILDLFPFVKEETYDDVYDSDFYFAPQFTLSGYKLPGPFCLFYPIEISHCFFISDPKLLELKTFADLWGRLTSCLQDSGLFVRLAESTDFKKIEIRNPGGYVIRDKIKQYLEAQHFGAFL